MNYVWTIVKKELRGAFSAPEAYIVLIVFSLITGWVFANGLFLSKQATMDLMWFIIPVVYLFFIPAITMGTIAREKMSGTFELAATLPMNEYHFVWGKFLASLCLILVALLTTVFALGALLLLGQNVDMGPILGGYFGLILLGAVLAAGGIFASSLTDNQVVAFIIGFFIAFLFYVIRLLLTDGLVSIEFVDTLRYISIFSHFHDYARGVVDLKSIVMMVGLMLVFLFGTVQVLQSRKWR